MKKILLSLLLILFAFGCASKEAVKTTGKEKTKTEKKAVADNSFQAGLDAYKARDYEKARGLLVKATQQQLSTDDVVSSHKHLAFIYALQGNHDGARKEFAKAFKLDKGFELDKSELGHPAWTPAFERVQKEFALTNAKGSDLFDDGEEFYSKRDYENAIRSLEAAVEKDDLKTVKKVAAYKLLAFVYAIKKNPAKAKDAFRKAFKLDNTFELDKSEYGNPVWTPVYDEVKKQIQKK